MVSRRELLALSPAAPAILRGAALTARQRVDRVLEGKETDRPAFTFWYHFLLEKHPGERFARATLDFHRKFRTDLVKVMSDYPYPKPPGRWWEAREQKNPFPEQIRALEIIAGGLGGRAHFVETIFNPWNQATKIASKEEVLRLKAEKPQALLDALEAIARSQANHARLAVARGASGVFLAIDNALDSVLTRQEYARFSEPFDRMILDAVRSAPLNILHLHGDKVYLEHFWQGWPVAGINYSLHATGVCMSEARSEFGGLLLGGFDEQNFRKLSADTLKQQYETARAAAGPRFLAAGGCSVPNDTTDTELLRVTKMFGA